MKMKTLICVGLITLFTAGANADLVSHWTLDNDGTDIYASNDGTVSGSVSFNGSNATFTNGVVQAPYTPELNTSSFTVTAWVDIDDASSGYRSPITSRFGVAGQQKGYIIYAASNGNWEFWTGTGSGWDALGAGPVTTGLTHLAISYDADTGTKSFYVNGTPVTSNGGYSPNLSSPFNIGKGEDTGTNFHFPGTIDDVGYWNVALTPTEVETVMDNGVTDQVGITPPIVYSGDLTVYNPSFEIVTDPNAAFNAAGTGDLANWFNITNGLVSNDPAQVGAQSRTVGIAAPGIPANFTDGIDGEYAGHINSGAVRSLVQNIDAAFVEGMIYTLEVAVGRRVDHDALSLDPADWEIAFHLQETGEKVASITGQTIPGTGGIFFDQELEFVADANAAGNGIQIRLTNLNTQASFNAVNFDSVNLTVIPEPASFALFGLALLTLARRRLSA